MRAATIDDRDLLRAFRSATSEANWDVEVERFISSCNLFDWWRDPHAAAHDPRLLLLFTGDRGLPPQPLNEPGWTTSLAGASVPGLTERIMVNEPQGRGRQKR